MQRVESEIRLFGEFNDVHLVFSVKGRADGGYDNQFIRSLDKHRLTFLSNTNNIIDFHGVDIPLSKFDFHTVSHVQSADISLR